MIVNGKVSMRGESLVNTPVQNLSLPELAYVYAYLAQTLPQGENDPAIFEVVAALENYQPDASNESERGTYDEGWGAGHDAGYEEGYDDGLEDSGPPVLDGDD